MRNYSFIKYFAFFFLIHSISLQIITIFQQTGKQHNVKHANTRSVPSNLHYCALLPFISPIVCIPLFSPFVPYTSRLLSSPTICSTSFIILANSSGSIYTQSLLPSPHSPSAPSTRFPPPPSLRLHYLPIRSDHPDHSQHSMDLMRLMNPMDPMDPMNSLNSLNSLVPLDWTHSAKQKWKRRSEPSTDAPILAAPFLRPSLLFPPKSNRLPAATVESG